MPVTLCRRTRSMTSWPAVTSKTSMNARLPISLLMKSGSRRILYCVSTTCSPTSRKRLAAWSPINPRPPVIRIITLPPLRTFDLVPTDPTAPGDQRSFDHLFLDKGSGKLAEAARACCDRPRLASRERHQRVKEHRDRQDRYDPIALDASYGDASL